MGDSHIIKDVSELGSFENACNTFREGLQSIAGRFQSETDALAGAWRDEKYTELRSRVEPILRSARKPFPSWIRV